jgi:hypothetical protein
VWLMLLGVLCVGVIPGDAVARKFLENDTEGDPGDGNEYEGGGGGGGSTPIVDEDKVVGLAIDANVYRFEVITFHVSGQTHCIVVLYSVEFKK